MSILAAADAATQPTTSQQLQVVGFFLAIALAIAAAAGVFRRGSIRGPLRLARSDARGGLFAVMLLGIFVWLGAQIVIGYSARARYEVTAATQPFGIQHFTAADYALLATVPAAAGILVLLAGDVLISPRLIAMLGLRMGQLGPGFLRALVGIIILLPVVSFSAVLLELWYRQIGYEHPSEHDLLRVMKDVTEPLQRIGLIAGATILAPVFEEILFRGHLQSLIVSWIGDIICYVHGPAPPTVPVDPALTASNETAPAMGSAETERPLWSLWLGVIITSLLFAIIHAAWSAPMIFLLSIGLGYAYERTGNLWVPLGIHVLFNAFNTSLFLLLQGQN